MCIAIDHDPWLVALAVAICGVGAFAIVQMFERARDGSRAHGVAWAFLVALAFEAKAPVTLDPVLTIASLMVAMIGSFIGFAVAAWGKDEVFGAIGGALFGAAIAAMHFTGMTAYRVDGIVTWDGHYIAAAVICGMAFAAAALTVLRTTRTVRYRVPLATLLIVLAIASLHFLAMTAMRIIPMALDATPLRPAEFNALALATVIVGGMLFSFLFTLVLRPAMLRVSGRRRAVYETLAEET